MKTWKCYLSGPISNLTYEESIGWTEYACHELAFNKVNYNRDFGQTSDGLMPTGIVGYKPLRGKKYLKDVGPLDAAINPNLGYVATNRSIHERDVYDVESSDAVLINLLGAKTVSIGTVKEQSLAWYLRKPIVLVMEKTGNLHHHAFVLEEFTYWTDSLDQGIELIKGILLPD